MPTDERYRIWSDAIGSHSVPPYKGFICIEHFIEDDLEVRKDRTTLKKDALPKIFNTNHSNQCVNIADNQPFQSPVANVAQSSDIQCRQDKACSNCDELKTQNNILKAEYGNLREEFIELETKKSIEVAALETEIKKLKANADIQKQHIKYLSSKVYNKEKSNESLKLLLKQLQEQNILSTKAYETLEVILNLFYSFIFYDFIPYEINVAVSR